MNSLANRGDHRRAQRRDCTLHADIREQGSSHRFDIKVVDLSSTGFCCETSFTLTIGQSVFLRIPGFNALEARVAWRKHFRYGCEFIHTLHGAVLDHIVAHNRAV